MGWKKGIDGTVTSQKVAHYMGEKATTPINYLLFNRTMKNRFAEQYAL